MDPLSLVTAIGLSLTSYHFDRSHERNEHNYGIIIEVDRKWLGGGYRNSYGRNTFFVAYTLEAIDTPSWGLGVFAGPATGYDWHAVGGFRLRTKYSDVYLVPPLGPQGGVVSATLKWSFK